MKSCSCGNQLFAIEDDGKIVCSAHRCGKELSSCKVSLSDDEAVKAILKGLWANGQVAQQTAPGGNKDIQWSMQRSERCPQCGTCDTKCKDECSWSYCPYKFGIPVHV